jgi:NADH-quinone oxidoreductase subunit H
MLTVTAQQFVSFHVIMVVLHVILLGVAYLIYAERKVSAWAQDRLGPNRVGPIGLLQPIADGLKLFLKEDYAPTRVDKALFSLGPALIIIPALIGWAVIPWGGYVSIPTFNPPLLPITVEGGVALVAAADVNIGVIYLLAIASLGVYGVTLGGWASNNKYSFLGGLRCSAGMISYEIPLGLAILVVLLVAGTVHPHALIAQQAESGWFIVGAPLAAILFYVCTLAEANRAPFDNAEAEQELVGGYHTEYSSMRFALFLLAEYAHMITGAAFFVLLFLGGYHLPFVSLTDPASTGLLAMLVKFLVFAGKTTLIVLFGILVRWTLPRIRWDQVMKLAWNGLIPFGIVLMILTSVMVYFGWTATWQTLAMHAGLALALVAVQPLLPKAMPNRRVAIAGSRYSRRPGDPEMTAPAHPTALDEMAPAIGAEGADGREERVVSV